MDTKIIISEKNVKPISPTPRHLKTYKLSLLDQMSLSTPVPVVLYFPSVDDLEATTQLLKHSLSVVLTRFYPLAGKAAVDGQSIDCDDSGVPFAVVKFTGDKFTDPANSNLYLPGRDGGFCPDSNVMMVQVNYLAGEGLAIGAVFWHKMVDACTISSFLRAWSATARGSSKDPVSPNFVLQSLFPSREQFPDQFGWVRGFFKTRRWIMRRYVFDASTISSLKAKSGVENPTRVEVVSALIWMCFTAASLANNKSVSLLLQAVNLRRRARPVFSSDCFGNFIGAAVATTTKVGDPGLEYLVTKMRDAMSKIDGEYVNEMVREGGLSGYHENNGQIGSDITQDADLLLMSSWCGFGVYRNDFGWGMPVWISWPAPDQDTFESANACWLMDSGPAGDGVEASLLLEDKYVLVFDNVEELRALAIVDPNPLLTMIKSN